MYDGATPEKIHEEVYAAAKENVPAPLYDRLTDQSNKYRGAAANNTMAFYNQLPFYVVKPLYTGLAYLLYKCGISLTMSTIWPSVFSYFFAGLLLFYWIQKYWPPAFAFLAAMLVMLSAPLLGICKLSTPDAMSGLILFAAIFFLIERQSLLWGTIFLLLAILTRLDNVIPATFLLIATKFSQSTHQLFPNKKLLLLVGLVLLTGFCVSLASRSFGWNIFYYPTFMKQLNSGYEMHGSFELKDYVALAKSQLMTGLFFSSICIFLLLILFLFTGLRSFSFSALSVEQIFAMAFVLIMISRFLLQPLIADRIYIPYYLSLVVFLVRKYSFSMNGIIDRR